MCTPSNTQFLEPTQVCCFQTVPRLVQTFSMVKQNVKQTHRQTHMLYMLCDHVCHNSLHFMLWMPCRLKTDKTVFTITGQNRWIEKHKKNCRNSIINSVWKVKYPSDEVPVLSTAAEGLRFFSLIQLWSSLVRTIIADLISCFKMCITVLALRTTSIIPTFWPVARHPYGIILFYKIKQTILQKTYNLCNSSQ